MVEESNKSDDNKSKEAMPLESALAQPSSQGRVSDDVTTALPVVAADQEERERAEIQLRALRTALLGLEAENAGLRQANQRLNNEVRTLLRHHYIFVCSCSGHQVAILDSESKRLFDEAQQSDRLRDEAQALRALLNETAEARTSLDGFLRNADSGALEGGFVLLLQLLREYEQYIGGRTRRSAEKSESASAAALAEAHAEEMRTLWQHVSVSNRNLLRLLTQQTTEAKKLAEQLQAQKLRNHMLVDSSNGLKSALARAATVRALVLL